MTWTLVMGRTAVWDSSTVTSTVTTLPFLVLHPLASPPPLLPYSPCAYHHLEDDTVLRLLHLVTCCLLHHLEQLLVLGVHGVVVEVLGHGGGHRV